MKGKIEIICDEHGTHLSVDVHQTKDHDTLFLVHALGKALGLEPIDYTVLAKAEADGILNGVGKPTVVSVDTKELLKQLKEEQNES